MIVYQSFRYLFTQLAAVKTMSDVISAPEHRILRSGDHKTIACQGISAKAASLFLKPVGRWSSTHKNQIKISEHLDKREHTHVHAKYDI